MSLGVQGSNSTLVSKHRAPKKLILATQSPAFHPSPYPELKLIQLEPRLQANKNGRIPLITLLA